MTPTGLLAAGRYTGLRPCVPHFAWRALTARSLSTPGSSVHPHQLHGLKVFAQEAAVAANGAKTDSASTANFSSAAAAALKTPIAYGDLTIGTFGDLAAACPQDLNPTTPTPTTPTILPRSYKPRYTTTLQVFPRNRMMANAAWP